MKKENLAPSALIFQDSHTAPGHISLFFEPCINKKNPLRQGSRGAGISFKKCTTTKIEVRHSEKFEIEVYINGVKKNAPVTLWIVNTFRIQSLKFKVQISTETHVPVSQGFGTSASAAIGTAMILYKFLGSHSTLRILRSTFHVPRSTFDVRGSALRIPHSALYIAHLAELENKTGLGDVSAITVGGFEIRVKPGMPYYGVIKNIKTDIKKICVGILGKSLKSPTILTNKRLMARIKKIGRYCTEKLIEEPSVENLFTLGNYFSRKTGLQTEKITECIEDCSPYGYAAQCMLGNSVVAVGNLTKLKNIISKFGTPKILTVERNPY